MTDGSAGTQVRKVVTVLFTDISGSTGLGETLDPESLRHVLSRYFAEMQRRRGAPRGHRREVHRGRGDGRLRHPARARGRCAARRSGGGRDAREARRARTRSSRRRGASRRGPYRGQHRRGAAGEPGAGPAFVVGDAVNTAARLEQSAQPDEILIGEDTYRLVHDAVVAELVGPLELRGKTVAGPHMAPDGGDSPSAPAGAVGSTRRSSRAPGARAARGRVPARRRRRAVRDRHRHGTRRASGSPG